ncbi:DMT family transporter [Xanthobacter agilis]|jgi:drug/metabolite transporter (DMT)-like permease|uniref:Drug/metabolite transporter (DMT)-like permease n=1 Tax=Xanthobacter agilis TaxID=47492 RepID=A0ABU0L8R7_XANAG|nr:EamA family transporter [Xanthobacter agilis]MDQ0503508.1 drug/metabolite transporter (DMT)-like permease [Xanthobacter agilis]
MNKPVINKPIVSASPRSSTTPGIRIDGTLALIVLFCLIWSSAFAAAKTALADCPPLLLLSARFLLAGGVLLFACAMFGAWRRVGWRVLSLFASIGVLNNAAYLGFSYWGMTTVSSGFTAVVVSATPLITALAAAPLLGERMTGRKLFGLLLGVIGVAIVLRSRIGGGHEDPVGALFVLAALLALTAGTLAYKRARLPPGTLLLGSGVQALAGGLVLAPIALLMEDPARIHLTPALTVSFLYLTLGASVGAFSLWLFILNRSSATRASALHFLMPPLGLLFGWLLLGETVPPLDLLGILPIAVGIRLVTTGEAAAQKR